MGVWRDSHFKVEGKGVYGLQSAFLVDWSTVERVHLDTSKFFPEADNYTSSTMQFATSGPLGPWRTLLQGIMTAIAGARRSICIQTPYFLPTEGLNSLLQTAALGGIDVQLMLPERSDSRIIDKAVHSFIDDMLRAGVKVYFYTKGFLHAKMLIVDDLLTVVGSANMDFRSFEHNFEINAFVYGQDFNTAMRRVFDEDLRRAGGLFLRMVAATSSAAIERVVHAALFPAVVRPEEAMTAIGVSVVVRFAKNIATPRKARSL